MKRKHLLFVGAIITIIALFGFGKTDAKADQEMVTEWFSEPHPEYFVFADCVEETSGGENATHYVYERYLWHDGKTWRATSKRLVPSDYTLNKYITSRDYGGVGKNTKKYNLWLSKEYDYPVQEESGGGYNVVSVTGEEFHAWSFYTVTSGSAPAQYRYRFSRTHNEYITYLNGYYRITTVPGKSFDVAGWGTESGTNLIIWDDIPPQANQTFLFSLQSDGSYIISDQNSGLYIDVDGDTVNGTNICMKTYTGGTSQRWYIGANSDGTYSLVSALFKVFVADIENGTDGLAGSNVHLWQWHGGQNQRFRIVPVVDSQGYPSDKTKGYIDSLNTGNYLKNSDINFDELFCDYPELINSFKELFDGTPLGSIYKGTKYFPRYDLEGKVINKKYYSSKQCFAFAARVSSEIFKSDCHGRDGNSDLKMEQKKIDADSISFSKFVEEKVLPGSIIRTTDNKGGGHSVVLLGFSENKVLIADNNVIKDTIRAAVYNWDEFRSFLSKKGKRVIDRIVVRKDYDRYIEQLGAKGKYDREAAAAFAVKHYKDGNGACAAFVARCLFAGGLPTFGEKTNDERYEIVMKSDSRKLGLVGNLRNELVNEGWATEIHPKQDGYLTVNDYSDIAKGDVVIWKDGNGNWVHAAIISGFDDLGNAIFAMHNNAHNESYPKKSNWGRPSRECELYLFHINY